MALSSWMELFWVGEAAWRNVDVSCLVYVGSVCTRRNASKVATHLSATVSKLYTTTTYCRRRNSASSLAIRAVHWKGEPLRYRGNTVLPK